MYQPTTQRADTSGLKWREDGVVIVRESGRVLAHDISLDEAVEAFGPLRIKHTPTYASHADRVRSDEES